MTYVNHIEMFPKYHTVNVKDTFYISARTLPEDATYPCVTFSSTNPIVAAVNPDTGLVYALREGNATLIATPVDGGSVRGYCSLTVENPIPVTSLEINPAPVDLTSVHKGDRFQMTATTYPETALIPGVYWTSSASNVATVDTLGYITAKGAGVARITAHAEDMRGASAYVDITVKQSITDSAEEDPANTAIGDVFVGQVDTQSGAHLLVNRLLALFGGQEISLVAQYNSTHSVKGMLGFGWQHNYEKYAFIDGDYAYVFNGPAVYSSYKIESTGGNTYRCQSSDKYGYVLTVQSSGNYRYTVNCNSERTEYYNADGLLAKIVDHQGFETLITHTSTRITITDGITNKKIYLEKDSTGKLVRVYDETNREVVLGYTGDYLTSILDANGNTTSFTYDEEGRIKTGIDGTGTCCFENTYDSYDRIVEQKDGSAPQKKTAFQYNGLTRTTTDRNGKQSTRVYNVKGLLLSYTDENGNTRAYEYDSAYNITKNTDALGNSVIKVYNSFNKPTRITDRNGNVTRFTYDYKGNLTRVQYPSVDGVTPVESYVYNAQNQITQHTDLRGTVTLYTYDENRMLATKKVGTHPATAYLYVGGYLSSQTDPLGHVTSYTYNTRGQLAAKTDADSKVTSYEYDAAGNLLRTVDANGKSITMTYDANHQKTSVTDQNGNQIEYSYNGNMKNDLITYPDDTTVRYEFDGEDRPIRAYDRANHITEMVYDDGGRLITRKLPDNSTVQYEYDSVGNLIKETNPKGGVTVKTYDKNGNVLSVTDPAGNITYYEYNALSKVKRMINALTGATVYTYSAAGDLLQETDPLGKSKVYTYDAFGNLLTETDPEGNVTTYTYDACDNLLTVKDPLNNVTTYTYDALHRLATVKDARNYTVGYGYDALGRRTTVTDARGNVFTSFYDGNGNVIKTTDGKGNTVNETVYNFLNLPTSVTDVLGLSTTYTYNALGKVATITDAMDRCSEFFYNARGMNTSVKDPDDNTSSKTYDALGNVTRLAGPLGSATLYNYDTMGRMTSESTVSGGSISYTYQALNLVHKRTNARNQIREYFYDNKGRITGFSSPEGAVSYTYDDNGNVLTVSDNHGTITRTYDALNRVTSCTDTYGKTISYLYDAVGNISRITYPDNTSVNYTYDGNHNLTCVTDWSGRVTTYTYDENNRVVNATKPDGSITAIVYDAKQRITSTVERDASDNVIVGFEYTYDDLSRIVEEKNLASSVKMCYTYDELGRVTKSTRRTLDGNFLSEESFAYDAAGNITEAPDACFAYGTNNRLSVFDGSSVSYDMDGNMLSNGVLSLAYDSANRLISAGSCAYTYNAEDVRIACQNGSEITTYTYDTNCRLSRLLMKTTGGVVTKYVYGRGLIGEQSGSEFKTYHFDCRGSTVAITDLCGDITDTFRYDTYGKLIGRTGTSAVIFGYNGRDGVVTDPNALIYMRARYYSPAMKRFVNADIVPGRISNAVTLNRFAYANANPVMYIDPTGLLVGALIAGGVLLTGLLFGLTASSPQEESSDNQSASPDYSPKTTDSPAPAQSSPKITSMEQARSLYLSGQITLDEIPPQYSWEPSIRAQYTGRERELKENYDSLSNSQKTEYQIASDVIGITGYATDVLSPLGQKIMEKAIRNSSHPNNIGKGMWAKQIDAEVATVNKVFDYTGYGITSVLTLVNTGMGIEENIQNGEKTGEIISDAAIDIGSGAVSITTTVLLTKAGTAISPGWGTVIGLGVGLIYDFIIDPILDAAFE